MKLKMTLHLYYKEGALTKWRKVPIDFTDYDKALEYYNKHFKGSKYKILFDKEEEEIEKKIEKRKKAIVKTGKTLKRAGIAAGKNLGKYAKSTHERLKVAGPRDMDRITRELGEPKHKPITAYDTTLKEIREDRYRKEHEVTDTDLKRLAQKREKEKIERQQRKKQVTVKKKTWQPPASPFGEFHLNLDQSPFETQQQRTKQYEKGGPGFKTPFKEVHFNPNVNPFGFEFEPNKSKRRKK